MLDILRKQAASWLTKTFLGLIALVFVFYFGWSALQQKGASKPPVAEVNGDPIYQQELDFFFGNQLEAYQKTYPNPLPDPLIDRLRQMTLQSLIAERVISQEAHKLGLRVGDAELRDLIQKDPILQIKGKFDPDHYRDVFRPWFFNKTGLDYETTKRRNRLQEKLVELIKGSLFVSDEAVKNQYRIENTKFTLKGVELKPDSLAKDYQPPADEVEKRIALRKKDPENEKKDEKTLASEIERELVLAQGAKKAKESADQLWPLFSSGKKIDGETEWPPTPFSQISSLFGEPDPSVISAIAGLSPEKPYPSSPLQVGQTFYLIKLVKKEILPWEELEKGAQDEFKNKLSIDLADRYLESWFDEILSKAKIKIHESS